MNASSMAIQNLIDVRVVRVVLAVCKFFPESGMMRKERSA